MRAFISYSSKDRPKIGPIVERLSGAGIDVWWDRYIEGARRWGREIELELDRSDFVLGFLSPNVYSSKTDYIYVELLRARHQGKLVPVVIGNESRPFSFDGLIALVQTLYFKDYDEVLSPDRFEDLLSVCRRNEGEVRRPQGDFAGTAKIEKDVDQRIENWTADIEEKLCPDGQAIAVSLALSLSLFEGQKFTRIESFANSLAKRIRRQVFGKELNVPDDFPRRRTSLLKLIESTEIDDAAPASKEHIRFVDPERAVHFICFFWIEYSGWRRCLVEEINDVVDKLSNDELMRLGYAIGTLAQRDFDGVMDSLVGRWLKPESSRRKEILGDIVLSVAAFEPTAQRRVSDLIKSWASSNSQHLRVAAIRLACGYVGARLPELSIEALHRVVDSEAPVEFDLLNEMTESLKSLIEYHINNSDDSLFGLNEFIAKLGEWVVDHNLLASRIEDSYENPYPVLLVLFALDDIPIGGNFRGRKRLSLASLVAVEKTKVVLADVFQFALERPVIRGVPIRKIASRVLRNWKLTRQKYKFVNDGESDPLLEFVQQMFASAKTRNDEERLIHLFRSVFSQSQIQQIDSSGVIDANKDNV